MFRCPRLLLSSSIILFLFVVSTVSVAGAFPAAGTSPVVLSDDGLAGPYLDKLSYQKSGNITDLTSELQSGSIDAMLDGYDPNMDPAAYAQLVSSEDISTSPRYRNGYGYMVLNTQSYPLNYTVLRRAISFGMNKTEACEKEWNGLASPQDSPVPLGNPYCVESLLPFHYYNARLDLGNQLLDAAGFAIPTGETYRRTPKGDAFHLTLEAAQSSYIAIGCSQIFCEALEGLHINNSLVVSDFYETLNKVYLHGDWDCFFLGRSLSNDSISWLLDYESQYANEDYHNYPSFMNSTYDSYCSQFSSPSYQDFLHASYEMQLILAYECPIIPVYCNHWVYCVYRTDEFQGFVNDRLDGITNRLTYEALHQKQGNLYGGTFKIGFSDKLDTLNFMLADSDVETNVLANLYDSLMRIDSNGQYIPWIARSVMTQTHTDNSSVPSGCTQLVIDIRDDVRWSDGSPLTAEDVAYTFLYYHFGVGNPYGQGLENLTSAHATSPTRAYLVFANEAFWEFRSVLTDPIISKAEFLTVGYDGWDEWNPTLSLESMRTTGPFKITSNNLPDSVELSVNPFYFLLPSPSISHPDDVTISAYQTGANITWQCFSRIPQTYELYRNESLIDSGLWNGSDIVMSLGSLARGVYEYRMIILDVAGRTANDTVLVRVTPLGFLDFLTPSNLITLGSLTVIGAVTVLFIKNRRHEQGAR